MGLGETLGVQRDLRGKLRQVVGRRRAGAAGPKMGGAEAEVAGAGHPEGLLHTETAGGLEGELKGHVAST